MDARRTRVAVAAAIVLVLSGGAIAVAAGQDAPPRLAPVEAGELIGSTLEALGADPAVSGRVQTHADLGIPQILDGPLAQEALGPLAILGDHDLRVWRSPDGVRVTDLLALGERSLFVDRRGGEAWGWDSESFTAYRMAPPSALAGGAHGDLPEAPSDRMPLDPGEVARRVLEAVDPSTAVSVGLSARVAGRDAYVLALEPRTPETLVGRVEVAVDADRRLPLSVAVFPRGADAPALSAAFTSVSFEPVDPAVFAFSPPEGATVRDLVPHGASSVDGPFGGVGPRDGKARAQRAEDVATFGDGWATVVAVRLAAAAVAQLRSSEAAALLPMSGSLFSARLVDRPGSAWLVFGLVPQATLAAVETRLP